MSNGAMLPGGDGSDRRQAHQRRTNTFMSQEDANSGKKSQWNEIEITGRNNQFNVLPYRCKSVRNHVQVQSFLIDLFPFKRICFSKDDYSKCMLPFYGIRDFH